MGIYWVYNPVTNLLLTSWDIQVVGVHLLFFVSFQELLRECVRGENAKYAARQIDELR